MAQVQDILVRIKVDDGQAKVQIDQLGGGFMRAQKAAEAFQEAIKRQDPILKGSVADYRRQIKALKEIRDNSAKTAADYKRQTLAIEELQVKMRGLTETTMTQNKVNEDQISNAGLAGATLTEFGRTISDLPFGITAITNNLSQLATLMVTLMAKTGGTTKAFKMLGRQIKGPLGIILVFQIVIALVQQLFGGMSKAEEAVKSFNSTLKDQIALLSTSLSVFQNFNLSAEDASKLANTLRANFNGLNIELNEFNSLTDESVESINKFIEAEAKGALIKSIIDDLIEKRTELLKLQTKESVLQEESIGFLQRLGRATAEGIDKLFSLFKTDSEKSKIQMEKLNKEVLTLERMLTSDDLISGLDEFFASLLNGSNNAREKIKPLVNEFKSLLDMLSEEELPLFVEAMFKGISVEQLERQKNALSELQSNATDALKGLRKLAKKNNEEQKDFLKIQKEQADALKQAIKDLLGAYEGFKQAGDLLFEAEISREERKTVLINNQIRKRLDNERLSIKQRESLENQITANEENLARKRDKIAEKQFKIQKALAFSEAMVTAFMSASRARDNVLKGPESFLGVGSAVLAKIMYGVVLAQGLATASAISRQQFVPSAIGGSASGGAGGAGGAQAPSFNIVGAGTENQLAQAISERERRPLRAYVVGKDITSQQELDRNINRVSGLG